MSLFNREIFERQVNSLPRIQVTNEGIILDVGSTRTIFPKPKEVDESSSSD